jgi:hypothetical protein
MSDYDRELCTIDASHREQHFAKLMSYYINGKVRIGEQLFILCYKSPVMYGEIIKRILKYEQDKKSVAVADGQTTEGALEVQDRSESL